jgi:diadenosine tetraphosphate (Ap4A) HIT family hydrolase
VSFELHKQLEADTIFICDLPLSRVLLMNNSNFPWLILVPRKSALKELFDLGHDYPIAMQEVRMVSEKMAQHTRADKMNIAALGNMVPQLHIHIIARFKDDSAWPNPVWNSGITPASYNAEETREVTAQILSWLGFGNITKM